MVADRQWRHRGPAVEGRAGTRVSLGPVQLSRRGDGRKRKETTNGLGGDMNRLKRQRLRARQPVAGRAGRYHRQRAERSRGGSAEGRRRGPWVDGRHGLPAARLGEGRRSAITSFFRTIGGASRGGVAGATHRPGSRGEAPDRRKPRRSTGARSTSSSHNARPHFGAAGGGARGMRRTRIGPDRPWAAVHVLRMSMQAEILVAGKIAEKNKRGEGYSPQHCECGRGPWSSPRWGGALPGAVTKAWRKLQ